MAPSIEPLSREDLDIWADEGKTGLVLHSIGNDHNIGAIIRSAAFFDASWIVISGSEDFQLSTSVYRVAEGGMEHVTVRSVNNAAGFLHTASKKIITIGTDIRARQRIKDMPSIVQVKTEALLKKKVSFSGSHPGIAVVLGNEETGLPPEVKEACSCLMRVPGTGLMESLNVSQVAALFLNELYSL
jgi:TrmH RNA methyltransferase